MAEYKTHLDEESGITFIDVSGVLDTESVVPYMQSKPFIKRSSRVLCDLCNASLENMTRGELMKMLREVRQLNKSGVRAAYVLNKGEDLGKAKAMVAQLETLGYDGTFKLFTDREKAVVWVKE